MSQMVRELRCLYKPTSNTFYSSLVLSYTYRGLKWFQALDLCFWNNIQKKVPIIDPKGTSNRDQGLKNQRKKNQKHIFCKIWSSFTNLMVCHGAPLKAHAWLEEDCSTQVAWRKNRRFMCTVKMSESMLSQLQVSVPSKWSRHGFSKL